ncbi:hypothetical protein [Nocardia vermiculata]|nr:hypothetical protein [Nocardia vermiculata]
MLIDIHTAADDSERATHRRRELETLQPTDADRGLLRAEFPGLLD